MTWKPVASEALFGSAARGDSDRASDIDYLIVDDDYLALRLRKLWLMARGYSVSDYTWNRLQSVVEAGTLFAMHLSREAKIIRDRSGRLAALLRRLRPKSSYQSDFQSSLLLFSPLSGATLSASEVSWACDVAAVAFRNSAILKLATEGDFVFGYEDILGALITRGLIRTSSLDVFRRLRLAKRAYRSGRYGQRQTFVDECLVEIERAIREPIRDLVYGQFRFSQPPSTDAYAYSRRLERALLGMSVGPKPHLVEERQRLLHLVRDPHAYLWQIIQHRPQIDERLGRLLNSASSHQGLLAA